MIRLAEDCSIGHIGNKVLSYAERRTNNSRKVQKGFSKYTLKGTLQDRLRKAPLTELIGVLLTSVLNWTVVQLRL